MSKQIHLVLCGGVVLGVAHAGVLKALDDTGVQVSSVTGTSAGALVGALYAGGYSGAEIASLITSNRLDRLLLDSRFVLGFNHLKLLWPLSWSKRTRLVFLSTFIALLVGVQFGGYIHPNFTTAASLGIVGTVCAFIVFWVLVLVRVLGYRPGLFKGKKLSAWVNCRLQEKLSLKSPPECKDLLKRFSAIATDLRAGEMIVLDEQFDNSMTVGEMVQASAAIPIVFPPMVVGKRVLADGGITQNFPVGVAQGIAETVSDVFITVKFEPKSIEPKSTSWLFQILYATIDAARSVQEESISQNPWIPIQLTVDLEPLDFSIDSEAKRLAIEKAYEEALGVLQSYRSVWA